MSSKHLAHAAAAAGLALLASGCAPVDAGLGEAFRYDMAIQTIDPDPVYPEDGAKPGDSGAKAADATKRYRTGAVTQVEATSASGSGAGAAAGPGGPN